MTRWRKRLGEAGAEQMLRETIEAGIKMGAIRPAQLKRINVDTTVQTKAIRFPTDARLYHRCRERLVKAARREGLEIKQSYQHVGKRLLLDVEPLCPCPADEAGARRHAQAAHPVRTSDARDRTASYRAVGEVSQVTGNGASNPCSTKA